jgi:Tfp pilus assembly major pilin PilA
MVHYLAAGGIRRGDEVIMSIARHVSLAMLSLYSHIRMEAKRRALDEMATRQRAADKKRKDHAVRREQDSAISDSGGGATGILALRSEQ